MTNATTTQMAIVLVVVDVKKFLNFLLISSLSNIKRHRRAAASDDDIVTTTSTAHHHAVCWRQTADSTGHSKNDVSDEFEVVNYLMCRLNAAVYWHHHCFRLAQLNSSYYRQLTRR